MYATDGTVIFADRFVQRYAGPFAGCKLSLSYVSYGPRFGPANPYSLSDHKTIRVLGEYRA